MRIRITIEVLAKLFDLNFFIFSDFETSEDFSDLVELFSNCDFEKNLIEGIELIDIKYKSLYIDIKLISRHKLKRKSYIVI
jgi:hypothetical protein